MLATRIIPILLHRGPTLYKGEKFNAWRSVGNALQAVKIYSQRNVDELIMLDIGATPRGRGPDLKMVEQLSAECFMPLTVGGGVRSVDDVRDLLNAGADKVAIGAATLQIPKLVRDATERFGRQAIVASMDVSGAFVRFHGVREYARRRRPVRWARYLQQQGVGEILFTSIDREGTMQGYDLDLIRAVSQAVSVPVIAHGGCSGYADMLAAIQAGASAVAAGALFQFTDATPRGAAEYLAKKCVEVRLA